MSNYCRFSYKKSLLSYIWSCLFFQNQTASRSDRAAFLVPISLCEWSDFPWPHAENRHYILYYVFPLMFLETGECDELVSYKGVLWIWYGHDNPYHMPFRKHFIGGGGGGGSWNLLGIAASGRNKAVSDQWQNLSDPTSNCLSSFCPTLRQWDL